MTTWPGYLGIEDLGMTANQRQTLLAEIQAQFGEEDASPKPNRRMQVRLNLVGDKAIFEAVIDESKLTVAAFKSKLATLFGVDASEISHTVQNPTFATSPTPVVTFSYQGTPKLKLAAFGGVTASWDESRVETIAYIAANAVEWETPE